MDKYPLTPHELPLPEKLRMPMDEVIPLAPIVALSHIDRLRVIFHSFRLSDKSAKDIIAAAGELYFVDGKPRLRHGAISKAQFSQWMSGYRPFHLWRMGAAVASLQFYGLEKFARYDHAKLPASDPRVQGVLAGMEQLIQLGRQESLSGWVWKFRSAIAKRLELDSKHDKEAKGQFVRYTMLLDDLKKEEFGG